jgi:hypothetical protein
MESMLVAVFGHYDSRGGTTAIPLKEATEAAVNKARKEYNRSFGIEEAHEPIERTAYGMEARVADQAVHELMYGDSTPGQDDFMYVAQLHYPKGADLEGDLEEPDSEGRYRRVLKEGGEMEERGSGPTRVTHPDLDFEQRSYTDHQGKEIKYEVSTPESDLRETLKKPIQLELAVVMKTSPGVKKLKQNIEFINVEIEDIRQRIGVRPHTEGLSYWDDPEYKRLAKDVGEMQDQLTERQQQQVIAAARVLKKPTTCRWDDDAFGFIIGTGL